MKIADRGQIGYDTHSCCAPVRARCGRANQRRYPYIAARLDLLRER